MAISFSCPECGNQLAAPDDAVGNVYRCPQCTTEVTCPEPVYEAEVVESPAADPVAWGELDAGQPGAAVATPVAVQTTVSEIRRPCPMCGEMIIATAAKCRFCGEVFDEAFNDNGKKTAEQRQKSFEFARARLLVCIFLLLGCIFVASGLANRHTNGPDPAEVLIWSGLVATYLGGALAGMVYTFSITRSMSSAGIGIVVAILAIMPFLGLLVELFVYRRALEYSEDSG
jgi:predicted RNA-binding Zn-ribbon protein involved in translation (DUF1610 family)